MDAAREMLYQPIKLDRALEGLEDTDMQRAGGRFVVEK
jgi:hypothetical protein